MHNADRVKLSGYRQRIDVMKRLAIAAASMLALVAASTVFASDIYKWIDQDGNVHYGDRPEGEQTVRVAIASKPTDPARIQAEAQTRNESRIARAEAQAAAAAEGPSVEDLKAEAEDRAKKCTQLKAQMQQMVTSRRLYREVENGERVYLDESETLAARERVENQVTEFCGS
jgi:hypothetical protein